MIYKWLVIVWTVTINPVHFSDTDCVSIPQPYESKIQSRLIEERHREVEIDYVLFKNKTEADKYIKDFNAQSESGNTKFKFQEVELKPMIEIQRNDASDEQKELLKGE